MCRNPQQITDSEGNNEYYSSTIYKLFYTDSSTGHICASAAVELSSPSCTGRICSHVFNVSSSTCPASTDIRVIGYTANLFGNRSVSGGYLPGMLSFRHLVLGSLMCCISLPNHTLAGTNNFVKIHFNSTSFALFCIFNDQYEIDKTNNNSIMRICSVEVYPITERGSCDVEEGTVRLKVTNSTTTNTVSISLKTHLMNKNYEVLCFIAFVSNITFEVAVKGKLSIRFHREGMF